MRRYDNSPRASHLDLHDFDEILRPVHYFERSLYVYNARKPIFIIIIKPRSPPT